MRAPAHSHHLDAQAAAASQMAAQDSRLVVKCPACLRIHTLANMRDHLQVVAELQQLLDAGSFDQASELAEQRPGMSSLGLHGAHEGVKIMPKGMQEAGMAMPRSASPFAIVAKDASVSGDLKAPLDALARLPQTCLACHAAYRIE